MGEDGPRRRPEGRVFLTDAAEPQRLVYGRRKGRPLRRGRAALLERRLPELEIVLPEGAALFDAAALFEPPPRELWLEIGFGGGEHLLWQARAHPGIGIIGCEPYLNGVARMLSAAEAQGIRTVRVFRDDARLLLRRLPDSSVGRAFVLFPDPWPKKRHHKRRIIAPDTLGDFARVLADDAELRVATDIDAYKAWMLHHVLGNPAFEWTARGPADWRTRPADWPETRYEAKARAAGRSASFFRFRRRTRYGGRGAGRLRLQEAVK